MNDGEIRIGFIGAGGNTRLRHLPGFREIEGVRLQSVVNRSEASSRKVAEAFDIATVATDWRSVVEDEKVDAICIGTWPYLHAPATIAALEAGKHVLTEARMAMDSAEAEAMRHTARRHPDRVAQIVPSPFTLKVDPIVREWIEGGKLGRVLCIRVEHLMNSGLDPSTPLNWRQDERLSGHNTLTLGIFHEVTQRWLDETVERVRADGWILHPERKDPETGEFREVRIPDALNVTGTFPSGARIDYRFSSLQAGPPVMRMAVEGTGGEMIFDVAEESLHFRKGNEVESITIPGAGDGWRVEADFIQSIRKGTPVTRTSFEEGLRYMKFTDAVWEARTSGREVKVS